MRRSCLAFCWFGSWCCGTVCLMAAVRRVHGSGGMRLWWSSVLSSHIAGCRCPGGREAHFRQCAGPSELFYAGLSGWERCSSRTRQWCSQSGCSPFVYKASVHNGTYVCLSVNKNENRNETYSSLPAVCRSCPSGKWVKHKHSFIK